MIAAIYARKRLVMFTRGGDSGLDAKRRVP